VRTVEICTALHVPNPRGERGATISATVIEHGFAPVTCDAGDFAAMGLPIVNL
jgi:hypothetical protein